MAKNKPNWKKLPNDILAIIVHKLNYINIKDYIHFGAVCRSWHSVYFEEIHVHLFYHKGQIPLLMLPGQNLYDKALTFYNITDINRLCSSVIQVPIAVGAASFVENFDFLSSHGWLVKADFETNHVRLLNPFLLVGNVIDLPPITRKRVCDDEEEKKYYKLKKVVLSANPLVNPNYIMMAIYDDSSLAFCRPGDKDWTKVDTMQYTKMCDVIYHNDQFYFVRQNAEVFVCDHLNHPPMVSLVAPPPKPTERLYTTEAMYLVESIITRDLFLIVRIRCPFSFNYVTQGFTVFKLDSIKHIWIEVKNLCNQAVFIGNNSSFSLSTSDFPGCKPNRIYYTEDDDFFNKWCERYSMKSLMGDRHYDMGVFNLEDRSIQRYYPTKPVNPKDPSPIWIEPTVKAPSQLFY